MYGRKRLRTGARGALFFTVLILLFGQVSCGRRIGDGTLSLLSSALDAEVTVETGDITYRATLRLGGVDAETGTRDGEISFLSPESVAGMRILEREGAVTLSYGKKDVPLTGDAPEKLLLPLRLLSGGDVTAREGGIENGLPVVYVTLSDGRVLTLGGEDGALLAVKRGDVTLRVSWIESRREGE